MRVLIIRFFILLGLFFSALATACTSSGYLPLQVGRSWTHNVYASDAATTPVTQTVTNVTATRSVNGTTAYVFGGFLGSTYEHVVSSDANGILFQSYSAVSDSGTPFSAIESPGIPLLRDTSTNGTAYYSGTTTLNAPNAGIYGLTGSYNATVTTYPPETVTVPAGTFVARPVYFYILDSATVNGSPASWWHRGKVWLADGVGIVKAEGYRGTATVTDYYRLTSTNFQLPTTVANQTIGAISFTPTTLAVGGATSVSATATSGLTVLLSSTTPGVCSVSSSTVTGIIAGTCTIAANQTGNANYNAATQVTQNITVAATAPATAPGAPTLTDGAENGISLWVADSPWGTTNASSHSGTVSFTDSPTGNYAVNANTSLTLATPLNFSQATSPVLTFWHKYDLESGFDYGYVEVSTNGGATWTQLASYTDTLAAWQQVSIDLGAYAGQPSVKVRFRLQTDNSVVYDGWYVDDISITQASAGTATATSSSVTPAGMAGQTIGAISFSPTTLAVGGTTTASATATSNLAVSFISTTPGACTVSGSTITSVAAGTCTIAANQAGNSNYNAATQATQTITIGKVNQAVSFGAAPAIAVGGTGTVSATGGASGNAVTFSSTTTGICTVSGTNGSTVTGVAAGTCTIAANQAGNASYNAATQVTQPITIGATLSAGSALNLATGWNLLGNSANAPLDVVATLGDATKITTVWKWNKTASKWAFYAPSMTSSALTAYAQGKGYDVLTSIAPKEGFWVNASTAVALAGPVADPLAPPPAAGGTILSQLTLVESDLQQGWNLVGSADNKTPSQLNQGLSSSLNAAGKTIVTAWAWDAPNTKWKFYAPALEAQGGTVLADYITGKSYLPFSAAISASDGFWLNIGTPVNNQPSAAGGNCGSSNGTVTSAGTCTIAANQTGNASYNAATQVTQTITIGATAQCSDFSGTWIANSSSTSTQSCSGTTQNIGGGSVTISQQGCTVSWQLPDWDGKIQYYVATAQGNSIHMTKDLVDYGNVTTTETIAIGLNNSILTVDSSWKYGNGICPGQGSTHAVLTH